MMMIWKAGLAANGKPPIPEIAEERVRIAETAESQKKGPAPISLTGERALSAAETAEPKQSSEAAKTDTDQASRSPQAFQTPFRPE